ncbi:MAG: flagellar hook-associated protein FlgL [Dehalococcoidia bacterium]|nr:flagellar hook-associated protein FlgL [Dehalococcoidia bacterium]
MRVTHQMTFNRVIQTIRDQQRRLDELSQQTSSQRRIRSASDDPFGATVALSLRSRQSALELQESGRLYAQDFLNSVEGNYAQLTEVLQDVRELTVRGANGALDAGSREKIGDEMLQLFYQAVSLGNAKQGERFLFAGQLSETQPFPSNPNPNTPITPAFYSGDSQPIQIRVDPTTILEVSEPGDQFLSIFETIRQVYVKLAAGTATNSADVAAVSEALDQLLAMRSEAGAKLNRLELIASRAADESVNLKQQLSEIEEVDLVESTLELETQRTVYLAALQTAAKTLQTSLFDFLRN